MPQSRRSFLKQSASAAAVTLSSGISRATRASNTSELTPGPGNKWPGRVVINFNKNAVTAGSTKPQVEVMTKMVDDAIKVLTDQSTVGEAWKAVFPSTLSMQSKIAIKINTVNTSFPQWPLLQATVNGLLEMDLGGTKFPKGNITVYDMEFMGSMEKSGYTAANFPGLSIVYTKLTDGGDGAMNNHQYASILKEADFLINMFSLRGHTTEFLPVGSRFTLGFKSHIGTYSSEAKNEGPSLHAELPSNLRAMNCTGPVYEKTVLSFCGGVFGLNENNGPPGNPQDYQTYAKTMDSSISGGANPTTILLSTDPVAVEMQSIKIMRINKSGKYAVDDMPPYLLASAGVAGKMDGPTYNIGIIDEADMDIRRVVNDITIVNRRPAMALHRQQVELKVTPMRRSAATFIEFRLSGVNAGSNEGIVDILALNGSLVKRAHMSVGGAVNHFSWDNRDSGGKPVGSGIYVVHVVCGTVSCSKRFTLS